MNPVSVTAHWVAAARAQESLRPDALFQDPYAASLAGEEGDLWLEMPAAEQAAAYVALRTRFFDDELLRAAREQGIRQIVILAAGMDARAYRLDWPPGTRVFELDHPEVLAFKEKTLAASGASVRCDRVSLGVDLRLPWKERLLDAGFSAEEPSAWLMEGLLVYLLERDVRRLFAQMGDLASRGSTLALDITSAASLASRPFATFMDTLRARGIEWHFTCDDPVAFLGELGWSAGCHALTELARRHGREMPADWELGRSYLVAAVRSPEAKRLDLAG